MGDSIAEDYLCMYESVPRIRLGLIVVPNHNETLFFSKATPIANVSDTVDKALGSGIHLSGKTSG